MHSQHHFRRNDINPTSELQECNSGHELGITSITHVYENEKFHTSQHGVTATDSSAYIAIIDRPLVPNLSVWLVFVPSMAWCRTVPCSGTKQTDLSHGRTYVEKYTVGQLEIFMLVFEAMIAKKWVWLTLCYKVGQSDPISMKLKLDVLCHQLNAYTKF